MNIQETGLKNSYLINLDKQVDDRGFFVRVFCDKEFLKKGLNTKWVQINSSMSKNIGTLRGLHFQKHPYSEIKLVKCTKGMIWDVVVDLRRNSKTYGCWFGANLSEDNFKMMYVPEGFAHGFISLEQNTEVIYFVSNYYNPKFEETLMWDDNEINVNWPIKPTIISTKDKNGLSLKELNTTNF